MTDLPRHAEEISDQLPDDAEVDTDEIEDRLDTLVNDYKVPMEEARRSINRNYIDDADDRRSENQEVDLTDIDRPEQWVDVTAKVVDLWEPRSDSVAQVGLLGDESGTLKFTKWANPTSPSSMRAPSIGLETSSPTSTRAATR